MPNWSRAFKTQRSRACRNVLESNTKFTTRNVHEVHGLEREAGLTVEAGVQEVPSPAEERAEEALLEEEAPAEGVAAAAAAATRRSRPLR